MLFESMYGKDTYGGKISHAPEKLYSAEKIQVIFPYFLHA